LKHPGKKILMCLRKQAENIIFTTKVIANDQQPIRLETDAF
jgi:hypothetical protein